jgi:predicted metal-dependent HD superfamily phosphohydrolase
MNDFTYSIETLKLGWETLLQPFLVEPELRQNVFFDLVTAYSSAGRFYHNLEHIYQVLETIEQISRCRRSQVSHSLNFPAIQLAAWFHDVIYDSKAKDNEDKSAESAIRNSRFIIQLNKLLLKKIFNKLEYC